MRPVWVFALAASLAPGVAGCRGLAGPQLAGPGTAAYQQARAERFDPYPENEPGPAVVGARPMEYQHALPEVERARWLPWNWGR